MKGDVHMTASRWSVFAVVAFTCVQAVRSATLTDITWVGAAGADFMAAENWSPAAVPSTSHRLVFTGDASPVIDTTDDGKVWGGALRVEAGDLVLTKSASAPTDARLIISDNRASEVEFHVADGASFTADVPVYASFGGASPRFYVKTGGGRMTSNVGFVNNDSIRVEGGVIEIAKGISTLTSVSGCLDIRSGATLRLLTSYSLENRSTVIIEKGGVLDLNGKTVMIAGITGSGTVTNSSADAATLQMTLYNGPYAFDGKMCDIGLKAERYGGSNVRATTEEEFGFIIGSADTLANVKGTLSWTYDSSLSDPALSDPANSWLRFAPGVGVFRVASENPSTTLSGYAGHPLCLEDVSGEPVTLLTRIATQHMPNIAARGSGSLYIGGYDVTLTGSQIRVSGTLGTLGGKDDGKLQTMTLGDGTEAGGFDASSLAEIDTGGGAVKFLNLVGGGFAGRVAGSNAITVNNALTLGELSTFGATTTLGADLTVGSGHYIAPAPAFDFSVSGLTLTLNGGEFSRPYEAATHVDDAFLRIPLPHSALLRGSCNHTGTLVMNGGDFYALNNGDWGVRYVTLNAGRFHIQYATPYKPVAESTAEEPTVFTLNGGEIVVSRKGFNSDIGIQEVFEDTDKLALRVGTGGAGITDGMVVIGVQNHETMPILVSRPFTTDPDCVGTDGGLRQRGTRNFMYKYPLGITGAFTGEGGTSVVWSNASFAADNSFFGAGDTVLNNHSIKLQGRSEAFSFRPHGSGKGLSVEGSALLVLRDNAGSGAVSVSIGDLDLNPGSVLFVRDQGGLGPGSSTVKLATPPETLPNGRVRIPVLGVEGIYYPWPLGYSAEHGFTNLVRTVSAFGSGKIVNISDNYPTIAAGVAAEADMLWSPSGACGLTIGQGSSLTLGNGVDTAICHLAYGGIQGGEGATLSFGTSPGMIVCSARPNQETICSSFVSVPITAADGLSVVGVPDIEVRGWRGLRLTEKNTYSGVTRISSSIVQAEHEGCFSTGDVYAQGGDKFAGGVRFNKQGAVWKNNFRLSGRGIRATPFHRPGDLGFSMQFTADGEVAGDVELGYVARLSASTNTAVTGVVSGTVSGGKLELTYSKGVIRLTGANTYTNGTDIIQSNLEVSRGDSLGSGEVWLANGKLRFVNSEPVTFTNYVKGVGAIEVAGAPVTFAGRSFDALPVKTLASGSVLNLSTGYALCADDVARSTLNAALVVDGETTLAGDTTVAAVWGSGTVVGGVLTVTGEINPCGAGSVGTLVFALQPVFAGATLAIDTKDGAVDKVVVPGSLSLDAVGLRIVQIGKPVAFRNAAFLQSGGELSGAFASVALPAKRTANYSVSVLASEAVLDYTKRGMVLLVR